MYNKQLDAFIKSAETGSFSKAASELFITPSSLIQQINLLENHLGVRLFTRSARGVKLTSAGESVFEDAKNIVHMSNVAIERARAIEQKKNSVVRIGTTLLTRCRYLMDIWSRASVEHPEIKIELVAYNGKCNFYEIFPAKICIAVPSGHPLFSKDILTLSDLKDEKIVLGKRGHSTSFDEARNTTCELNNCLMVTLDVWADIYPSLKTCPVDWNITVPYGGFTYALNPSEEVQILMDTAKTLVENNYFLC